MEEHHKGTTVFLLTFILAGLVWMTLDSYGADYPAEPIFGEQQRAFGGLAFEPGDEIDPQYAPPWDVFSDDEMLFTSTPKKVIINKDKLNEELTFSIDIDHDDGLVYSKFYIYSPDSERWVENSFKGKKIGKTNWLIESGDYKVTTDAEQFEDLKANEVYLAGYSCKKYDGQWKCGCRAENDCGYWMLQYFEIEVQENTNCQESKYYCEDRQVFQCENDELELIDVCDKYYSCEENTENGESTYECVADLPDDPELCGNGICENGEITTCSEDCSAVQFREFSTWPQVYLLDNDYDGVNIGYDLVNGMDKTIKNPVVKLSIEGFGDVMMDLYDIYPQSGTWIDYFLETNDLREGRYKVNARLYDDAEELITTSSNLPDQYIYVAWEDDVKCEDEDGKNIGSKGSTALYANGYLVNEVVDFCESEKYGYESNYLAETYCWNSQIETEGFECPNGCQDGACVGMDSEDLVIQKLGLEGFDWKNTIVSYPESSDRWSYVAPIITLFNGNDNTAYDVKANFLFPDREFEVKFGNVKSGELKNFWDAQYDPTLEEKTKLYDFPTGDYTYEVEVSYENQDGEEIISAGSYNYHVSNWADIDCMDTDYENNVYVQGEVEITYPNGDKIAETDYCWNAKVQEAYCTKYNDLEYQDFVCQYGCAENTGTCSPEPQRVVYEVSLTDWEWMFNSYRGEFIANLMVGEASPTHEVLVAQDLLMEISEDYWYQENINLYLDSDVNWETAGNLLLVGTACSNQAIMELKGLSNNCAEGYEEGEGYIELFERDGYAYVVIGGWDEQSTANALDVFFDLKYYAIPYGARALEIVEMEDGLDVREKSEQTSDGGSGGGSSEVTEEIVEEVVEEVVESEGGSDGQ